MSAPPLVVRSEHRAFGGRQGYYEHASTSCRGPMRFAVYLPPAALAGARVPAVYFLAGLTCTEETFAIKAGAQRVLAEVGLACVCCDTSPRAARFPGDDAAWDFGQGAGFYLDATAEPWCEAYHMGSYVTDELPAFVEANFPVSADVRGIFGHSMGGHGALTLALRAPERFHSVSALAPIVAPSAVPWGEKAFTGFLGSDRRAWAAYDSVALLAAGRRFASKPLVHQGTADPFVARELKPELLQAACAAAGVPLELHLVEGYDHGYFFVSTFVEAHVRHHARELDLVRAKLRRDA